MAKKSVPTVKISSLIKPQRILIATDTVDKNDVIKRLLEKISLEYPRIPVSSTLDKIMERERGISTTLDTGLSIPHARIEDIQDFIVALALIPSGIKDAAQPGITVKAVFLFLSPADPGFFQKHLQLLSSLSGMFQPAFIDRLCSLPLPEQVLKEVESSNK